MVAAIDSFLPARDLGIRVMTEADVPRVVRIEVDSYPFPWSEGIFRDCLRAGYICYVAEAVHGRGVNRSVGRGEMLGYALMSFGAGEAHVLNLCVRQDARGAGVGRQLINHMLRRAQSLEVKDVFLEVRPSNVIAARLYHSLGFKQVGSRRDYYQAVGGREDALVLKLRLRDFQGD